MTERLSTQHTCGVYKNGTDEPICRAGTERQTRRTDTMIQWGQGRVGKLGD